MSVFFFNNTLCSDTVKEVSIRRVVIYKQIPVQHVAILVWVTLEKTLKTPVIRCCNSFACPATGHGPEY